MTATAPTGGTPEPAPDTGANTTGDTTAQQPPAAAPAGESERGQGFWSMVAEACGVAPGSPLRKRLVTFLVLALVACGATFREAVFDFVLSDQRTAQANDSNKKYDAEQSPFTVSVRPEENEPNEWVMVLDRTLTDDEIRKMQGSEDVFSYLKSLGGRPLAYASFLEHAPERYAQLTSSGNQELSDTFTMTVLSTRQNSVTVNDWKVTDLTCRESTAQTIVALPPQGGVTYEGVRLHLPPRAGEPVRTDDEDGQGEPYFAGGLIEVGGGQSAGALRAEVIAPPGKVCEWGIKLRYNDNYVPDGRWVQVRNGKGEPLRIRSESIPAHPRQKWVFGSVPWTACHEKSQEDMCLGV
ncbi:hypothetical protein [Streptomyces sp. NPDC000931]|uniref:hypothetical protein n=1 Tax=Streptomyces sp. NPDC000931 TaxID=3154372 RepID=UPI003326D768